MSPQLEKAQVLAATTIFGQLDAASLEGLASISAHRTYGRGQFLWYQGDPGDRLVVVCTGCSRCFSPPSAARKSGW